MCERLVLLITHYTKSTGFEASSYLVWGRAWERVSQDQELLSLPSHLVSIPISVSINAVKSTHNT